MTDEEKRVGFAKEKRKEYCSDRNKRKRKRVGNFVGVKRMEDRGIA